MIGRPYIIQFSGVAVSTAQVPQDLLEILAPSSAGFVVHEVRVTQDSDAGDAQSEQLRFSLIHAASSYTSGSGTAVTPDRVRPWDSTSAGITAERNSTTRATGGLTTLPVWAENIHNGFHYLPTPELRNVIALPNQAIIVGLDSTSIVDSLTMNAYALVEKFF